MPDATPLHLQSVSGKGAAAAEPSRVWRVGSGRTISLARPALMAILNVTPDSFSDGGTLNDVAVALNAAAKAVTDGAAILDIGGESTRPGATRVDSAEQIRRVVPLIAAIRAASDPALSGIVISIDTTLADVARAALDAGADIINDVSAGEESGDETIRLSARGRDSNGGGLVLMHRRVPPGQDSFSDRYSQAPIYADVVAEVIAYLSARRARALELGVAPDAIVLDPGLGFGKSVEQNMELIRRTPELCAIGSPILSGVSRKSFVGRVWFERESEPRERDAATLAFSALHIERGASVLRVHDVAAHAGMLRVMDVVGR